MITTRLYNRQGKSWIPHLIDETLSVGDTLTTEDPEARTVFPRLDVDPPTMAVRIRINDGPFAGREGPKCFPSKKSGNSPPSLIL